MKGPVRLSWLILVGVGILGFAAYLSAETLAFIHGAQRAEGQVVEMVQWNGAKVSPRVRFAAADGSEHLFTSTIRSNLPSVSVGEGVVVLYDQASPANAVIDSFRELWGGILLVGFLGTAFTGAGIVVSRRRAEEPVAPERCSGSEEKRKSLSDGSVHSDMKVVRQAAWLFLVVGLCGIGGAGHWAVDRRAFVDNARSAPGEVVDLVRKSSKNTYAPYVRFVAADGAQHFFMSRSSSNPAMFSRGEQVEVLYNPQNPSDAFIHTFAQVWAGPVVLGFMGTVFSLMGGGILLAQWLSRRKDEDLVARGERITATYQGVELNTSVTVNGRSPFRVIAQWRDPKTNKVRVFKSHNLWFNPEQFMGRRELTVLIDPRKPKRYHVDLSFLPESEEQA